MHWTFIVFLISLTGTVANVFKKQWCFYLWMVGNAAWCIYDWSIGARWQALQMFLYFWIAVWGAWQWRKKE